MNLEDLTLDIEQHIDIKAPPEKVFAGVLHRFGEGNARPDGEAMPMVLEAKPGGRWYRDRGAGIGHLWGFVQAIKPGQLLELAGPLFMSYPANNHVEIKLTPIPDGTKVTLRHRAMGMIDPEHRKGVSTGWNHSLKALKSHCE
ncbi:MAG TPA: SRPBCC domain-containing protein [Verrucomicrobiae bacterium]|nr:SRPBCC domain-containing protein [Verrucomicrobiae bacterium]